LHKFGHWFLPTTSRLEFLHWQNLYGGLRVVEEETSRLGVQIIYVFTRRRICVFAPITGA